MQTVAFNSFFEASSWSQKYYHKKYDLRNLGQFFFCLLKGNFYPEIILVSVWASVELVVSRLFSLYVPLTIERARKCSAVWVLARGTFAISGLNAPERRVIAFGFFGDQSARETDTGNVEFWAFYLPKFTLWNLADEEVLCQTVKRDTAHFSVLIFFQTRATSTIWLCQRARPRPTGGRPPWPLRPR